MTIYDAMHAAAERIRDADPSVANQLDEWADGFTEPVDSESPDAPYNPDIFELRRRLGAAIGTAEAWRAAYAEVVQQRDARQAVLDRIEPLREHLPALEAVMRGVSVEAALARQRPDFDPRDWEDS